MKLLDQVRNHAAVTASFKISERGWPERTEYTDDEIIWWRLGNPVDGYYYKTEAPNLKIIESGDVYERLSDVIHRVIDIINTTQGQLR